MQETKYPSTPHLPWSMSVTNDDKIIGSLDGLLSEPELIILEKMDGENTNLYSHCMHARSLTYSHHESRTWMRRFHASIAHRIPADKRLCGEGMFARHSIAYDNLESFFLLFSIWNEQGFCLSWDETVELANEIGVKTVPVLYRGPWDDKLIRNLHKTMDLTKSEGFVIRPTASFHIGDFSKKVAKFVRKGHVQTDEHWMKSAVIPNKLRDPESIKV
ncbi:RNA ligase family protein [Aeromonas veronii]|uniref:2'-5' RNA ligase n=1 Tax=Aeromonas veronii TaxID=654 RepID=A0A2T4MZN6_AERVE|nr:RNA ligase family protein [Aeromonas veronii]PTH80041.1 2'-5' RNA ligase [Aeromonas veronii]